jgi:tRNA nucleotidyltransferase (CCA-adding enzyme)
MEIYLVGGAVRDRLLGLPVKEKDWVVVGATADDMLRKGYRQVGKDFPVFLHPKTSEEYALARMERKVGRGYTGFDFDASPVVTLEQDLLRRDLTINAIAECPDGSLVDPYHGKADLDKKILRHVSPAFVEDPVRVLRVARFTARFAEFGFTVADTTIDLMQAMVKSGEIDALVAERVWKELERALQEKSPAEFFHVLAACGADKVLFPALQDVNLTALVRAAALSADAEVRFAALLYNLSRQDIQDLCDRYRVPSTYRELAMLVAAHYQDYVEADKLTATQWLDLLLAADAFRREPRFRKFLLACEAIVLTDQTAKIEAIYAAAKRVDIKKLVGAGHAGKEIAVVINKHRIEYIEKFINSQKE